MHKGTLFVLVAALVGLTAATARAGTTFTVTNTNDSGPGSTDQSGNTSEFSACSSSG